MTGLPTVQVLLDLNGDGTYETDVTSKVSLSRGLVRSFGRQEEDHTATPATLTFTLDNADGRFTNGTVNLQPSTPLRLIETLGATSVTCFTGHAVTLGLGWPGGGQEFATVTVTATDALADLSRRLLRSMLEQEVLALTPNFYYTLGEKAGATSAGDTSGNTQSSLTVTKVPSGSGAKLEFGGGTGPSGDSLTAVSFGGKQYLSGGPTIAGTSFTVGAWASFPTAFSGTLTILEVQGWTLQAIGNGTTVRFGWVDRNGSGFFNTTEDIGDGDVHSVFARGNGTTMDLFIDGALTNSGSMLSIIPGPLSVGSFPGQAAVNALVGNVSHVVGWSGTLTDAQIATIYGAGAGTLSEATDARLSRLASYGGLTATTTTPSGQLMDLQPTSGQTLFDAMQTVADAEGGVLYADGSGLITLQGRNYRGLRTTPDITLGETEAGEDTTVTWDSQQLVNQVTVTRTGGATQVITDGTPTLLYPAALELAVPTDTNALDAANWYLSKHDTTAPRIAGIMFDLLTSPSASSLFQLDLGDRLRLSTMPSQLWSTAGDYTLEGGTETLSIDGWTLETNLLPWDLNAAWILGDPVYGVLGSTTVLGY